ncbi:MAG: hypothetical protein H7331_01220 [Bacteroidia bacterium]|nr:hypothetical protein [Bacteroidia bacterium]
MRVVSFIIFITLFSSLKILAQVFSLCDKNVSVLLKKDSLNKDSIVVEVKNISNNLILISIIDGINIGKYNESYVGIGLYSSVFPFLPEHNKKYYNQLEMKVIEPGAILKIKEKVITNFHYKFSFSLDYVIGSYNNSNGYIQRDEYNKAFNFLKFGLR